MCRQSVHGLQTYTVQTYRLLVALGVVLAACVKHTYRLHHRIERNTSSEVPYCSLLIIHGDLNLLSETCRKLIYRVVYHLLQEYIYSVSQVISVSKTSDIHTWTSADMLHAFQGPDVVIGIVNYLCHIILLQISLKIIGQRYEKLLAWHMV